MVDDTALIYVMVTSVGKQLKWKKGWQVGQGGYEAPIMNEGSAAVLSTLIHVSRKCYGFVYSTVMKWYVRKKRKKIYI